MKGTYKTNSLLLTLLIFFLFVHNTDSQVKSDQSNLIAKSSFLGEKTSLAELEPITFNSHGSKLCGYFSAVQGEEGPHPTIVFLHGAPGGKNDVLGLAQAAPRVGWNALVFTFRGFWESEGRYSLKNSLEDVFSALNFLRSAGTVKKWGVDVDHIALSGYSFGSAMALTAAANDTSIKYAIGIALVDMGWLARQIEKSDEFKAKMITMLDKQFEGPIKGPTGMEAVEELLENADKFDLVNNAKALSTKSLLIIGGWKDQQSTLEGNILPFIRALQSHGSEKATKVIFDTDHSFKGKRTELVNTVINWLKEHHPQKKRDDVSISIDKSDIRAIKKIHEIAAQAVRDGDVATYIELFTEDGIYLWPGAPAIVGRDSLRAWFEKRFSEYSTELEKTIEEIEILGDWAFERGSEVSNIRNRSTDEVQVVRGKFINIFRKQSDGSWKIARRIRNLDHPPPSKN